LRLNRRRQIIERVSVVLFAVVAFFEIAGCFAFWMYFRQGRSFSSVIAGIVSLALFA
jgi:small multidrug resistance family-3 protein